MGRVSKGKGREGEDGRERQGEGECEGEGKGEAREGKRRGDGNWGRGVTMELKALEPLFYSKYRRGKEGEEKRGRS